VCLRVGQKGTPVGVTAGGSVRAYIAGQRAKMGVEVAGGDVKGARGDGTGDGGFNAHLGSLPGDVRPNGSPRSNPNRGPLLAHTQTHNLSILNLAHTHGQPTNISYSGSGGCSILTIPPSPSTSQASSPALPYHNS
jgi:hypothetical protein